MNIATAVEGDALPYSNGLRCLCMGISAATANFVIV